MTVVAPRRTYGGDAYGVIAYGGLSPASVIPTRNVSGIMFITSNDRYQVVTCSYGGSLDVAPEFRYWYAAPPSWAEELNNDSFLPPYYSQDEDGAIPTASLELPFRKLKAPQELLVKGVVVEFIPRPSSLTSDTVADAATLGFSVQVEGQATPDYERAVSGGNTGIVVSETLSFSESVTTQPSEPWPNIRTEWFPCRIQQRCRAARVVLTNVKLVEILSVQLIGDTSLPVRQR
jgi:hypothetical protein